MSSCSTGRNVFACSKKTYLLVVQEDMSRSPTRHVYVFLLSKNTRLVFNKKTFFALLTRQCFFLWSNQPTRSRRHRRPAGGTQEAPRRHPGGQRQLGGKMCVFICFFVSAKVMRPTTFASTRAIRPSPLTAPAHKISQT